jgi:hypothetical protein
MIESEDKDNDQTTSRSSATDYDRSSNGDRVSHFELIDMEKILYKDSGQVHVYMI